MMLSRLILNSRSPEVRRDLGDAQQLHRTTMSGFPQAPAGIADPRPHFGVLFRLEAEPRGTDARLLVQSRLVPDWSRLPLYYLSPDRTDGPNPAVKDISEVYQALAAGMILRFRLRANPTRKIDTKTGPDGHRRNGRRVELRTEQDQIGWLRRKGDQGGFTLLSVNTDPAVFNVRVTEEGKQSGWRSTMHAGDRHVVTFASVLFEGLLRINDAVAFSETLENGVGTGKAHGFGLVSIAPAADNRT
jgi:CRISPR system Cascade subunit CasE